MFPLYTVASIYTVQIAFKINEVNNMSINRNASMRPETNPAGNLLQEISEAELNQLSAGAGEPRASWGDFCTSTLECTFGTMICCPPET